MTSATQTTFRLDPGYLQELATRYRDDYSNAQPFPYIVIDNFLPEFVLEDILSEFPKAEDIEWKRFKNSAELKLASRHEQQMGDATRMLLYHLNSSTFITFLEALTGISGIIPDPHFEGGGLHQIERGGYLKMHVDFNRHERLNLDRRLNLLIYLNKDWEEAYGGHLELWDQDMSQCHKKVLPIFNRCVIFSTTDFSYHGHPDPLNCPEDRSRKSLALYYYTNGRPAEEVKQEKHSTIFMARPDDVIVEEQASSPAYKRILKKLLPPILIDMARLAKR